MYCKLCGDKVSYNEIFAHFSLTHGLLLDVNPRFEDGTWLSEHELAVEIAEHNKKQAEFIAK